MRRAVARAPRPVKLEIGGLARREAWLVTSTPGPATTGRHEAGPFEDGSLLRVYADNVIEHITLDRGRPCWPKPYGACAPVASSGW
ncbi:MAG: hypothetical protein ACR2FE_04740 [Aeromicrobium sp.]